MRFSLRPAPVLSGVEGRLGGVISDPCFTQKPEEPNRKMIMTSMASHSKTLHGLTYQAKHRASCTACRRPREACYCSLVEPFDSRPRFVILTQPREAKHRFGIGRMVHLRLRNSLLIEGVDFSEDARVNREFHAPMTFPVLLYPGKDSIDLSAQPADERFTLAPGGKTLVVFVLDGTWKSVRKMIRLSRNVASLPVIRFMPPVASNYRIRRQPNPIITPPWKPSTTS